MKGDHQMSYKIIKATLPVAVLGALSQVAQADTLDDAIKDAKDAGFSTSVQTRTEKVSSQSEADRLNQEEANRVQALAQRIQAQIQEAKTSDQSVRQIVTSVLTDQSKTSTESTGQNQTIVRENMDAQKAYEESVRAVEAKNAKAQADYEAEKAKIAEENAKAQREYEAKKAKVEADNANNKKAYEESIKRIAAENKQAQDAYQANRQKAEAELHTKEWSDTKVVEDAKAAGVTVRPAKTVDKGTVKESDLAGLQSEYDKAVADVRAKLEVAKKEISKATVTSKTDNELKQYVATQQAAIKAIIDADNTKAATTHVRTVIKNGSVIEDSEQLKKEYQKLLQVAQDDRVRSFDDVMDYYKAKGLSVQDAYAIVRKLAVNYFLPILDLNSQMAKVLMATNPKVVEVPVEGTIPTLAVGTDIRDDKNPNAVAFRTVVDGIEKKISAIWNSNEIVQQLDASNGSPRREDKITLSDNYEEDLKAYKKARDEFQLFLDSNGAHELSPRDFVEAHNDEILAQADTYAEIAASKATRGGSDNAFANQNNMEIVKSSDSVQFLNGPKENNGALFDVRHSIETSKTPVFFPLADVQDPSTTIDTTMVRIPKGQSITVKYTLKNGQAYIQGKQPPQKAFGQFFAKDTVDRYKAESKRLTDTDIQDVYTIEATITNNGAVHDGDIIVGVRNNTWTPFYIGVANGTRPSDRIQWNLNPDDPSMAMNYRIDTRFRNQQGQLLSVGVPQGSWDSQPHLYHGVEMGETHTLKSSAYYVTGPFNSFDKAKETEMVDTTPIKPVLDEDNTEPLKWSGYRRTNDPDYPLNLPNNWKDQFMWTKLKYGMSDDVTFSAAHKTYNKVLLDWGARDDLHNWSSLHETGYFINQGSSSYSGLYDYDITLTPRPVKPPTELKVPKLNFEFTREITLPQPKQAAPVDPATVAFIEPVKWIAKYTKPYTEKPPVPQENPAKPPVLPEPKKPEEKPLPKPPKKEELPNRPELKAIASGSNSFVVRARKATRPAIGVERIQYVAEGRVSSANSLVVRTKNEVKRAGSGNSFIIRRLG